MKRITFLFILIFIAMNAVSQKKILTLEDLLPGGKTYNQFTPKADYKIQWYGDLLTFSNEEEILLVNPKSPDKKELLITLKEVNNLLKTESIRLEKITFVSIEGRTLASIILLQENRKVYLDLKEKKIAFEIPYLTGWENTDLSPDNRSIAYTSNNNLYLARGDNSPVLIAGDTNEYIVYGQAVHRNEFGIKKGTFWSPQGNYLAFYRMDETMVGDYPLVDISTREAKLKNIKYPMAGMKSHEVSLGIYDLQSGKIIYMDTGEPEDHYLTNISWDPSEKFIYIAELNREQNHLHLNKYDISTGKKVLILFEEKNDKYVEPEHPLYFLNKTPNQFIWQSKRDGYNHLYLYDKDEKEIKQLTSGNHDVTEFLGFDAEEKNIFYITNELNPIEFQVYKQNLNTGKKIQLTFEPGVHEPKLSASGNYILDQYSNLTIPLNIDLISTDNPKITSLEKVSYPYSGYTLPEISLGSLRAADGKTDLYYRLIKPIDFDPSKKYPTVIYVYGGPHSQGVKNNWMGSTRGWEIYMAQKGYVIFTLDNRGTTNRGLEFENVIHRNLGVNETADQMKGVELLQSLPYVDSNRIGVHGWSYGGFMTINMILRYPEVFKVAVAGGPVIDWKYYEIMYGERYMDSPNDNREGYKASNLNNLAGNLKGRLLVIHGDEDPTVVWQNSLSFLRACIKARTYPDYFVYPGHGHNMMGPDRIHLHEKITMYFEDYLK